MAKYLVQYPTLVVAVVDTETGKVERVVVQEDLETVDDEVLVYGTDDDGEIVDDHVVAAAAIAIAEGDQLWPAWDIGWS